MLCTHSQRESATDQRHGVFSEMLVRVSLHCFVSISNVTEKYLFFLKDREVPRFIVDGKCLDRP